MTCNNTHIHTNHVPMLDRGEEHSVELHIASGTCQKYVFAPVTDGIYRRRFILEEGAIFRGAALILGANMVLEMSVHILGSDAEASLQLLGLAMSGSEISISGTGVVEKDARNIKLRVDQTNILLGNDARIKGRPVLEVATDSIEGGHSCRIHRIKNEDLFYLESHGIDAFTAQGMLLEAEIHRCTDLLGEVGEGLKDEILKKLQITK